ncbi:MAG: hypothetical protein K6C12_12025 [Oscillospiraceae bacterium]|nr:hypothetical protein [Oscillospiraceae bacterium]
MRYDRQKREIETIDKILQMLPVMSRNFSKQVQTREDALIYLRDLLQNGTRLVKYIEQVNKMKIDCNSAKEDALSAINNLLEIIMDTAPKVYQFIKETENT